MVDTLNEGVDEDESEEGEWEVQDLAYTTSAR